jgi:hypothetical protein
MKIWCILEQKLLFLSILDEIYLSLRLSEDQKEKSVGSAKLNRQRRIFGQKRIIIC